MFSPMALTLLLYFSDSSIMFVTGLVTYNQFIGWTPSDIPHLVAKVGLVTGVMVVLFRYAALYQLEHATRAFRQGRQIIPLVALTLGIGVIVQVALAIDVTPLRGWLGWWFVAAVAGIIAGRALIHVQVLALARSGRLSRTVAIVGGGEQAALLLRCMRRDVEPWNTIVGIFDDRGTHRVAPDVEGHRVRGNIDDLIALVRDNRVEDIVVALPWSADRRIMEIVRRLDDLPVHIRLGSTLMSSAFPRARFQWLSGMPVLDIVYKPLSDWRAVAKTIEDKVIAGVAVVLLSPVLALVALAVRLDSPGPIIYRQPRYGFNNRIFNVYKFRSMYHGRPPESGVPQATRHDPRVTRVGAILRRTSLDELPQLFNVLEGTMSLVGPRPHAVAHNQFYGKIIDHYFARHKVKPGITGLAQVNGLRGETDTPEKMRARVQCDLLYIDTSSLWLDLKIMAKTVFVVFFQDTAY